MENKTRYQFDRLPMVLFLACLAVTVVAASRSIKKEPIDNLYSPIYYGDSNVMEGEKFWISCTAEPPISWYKDGEPIEEHFARHIDKDKFTFTTRDHMRANLNGKMESTLTVSRAVIRHKGKYQCNINHDNSYYLHVHPARVIVGNTFEADNDHTDDRISFEPFTKDRTMSTTMLSFAVDEVLTESSNNNIKSDIETILDEAEEKSREKLVEASRALNELNYNRYDSTSHLILTSTTSASPVLSVTQSIPLPSTIRNSSPHMTTHTSVVVHTTRAKASEVEIKGHHAKQDHEGKLTTDNKDYGGSNLRSFRTTKPLKFLCKAENLAEQNKVVWSKYDSDENKINVKDIKSLEGRYEIKAKDGTFVINPSEIDDAGNYTCSLDEEEHLFIAYGKNDDEKKITSSGGRFTLTKFNEVEDARLQIDNAVVADRGFYTCVVSSLYDSVATSETHVRVKDKLAALWPFLGICAEVFVLCAIILIYEKRRNKTDLDESDTDQSPDQKNDHHKDTDVRHRK
ncbi:CLUMA_CG021019, isoform A [Clunio marinus]|uniref:CLUMA_CG021019, isoform A n=1 Tax=Clunio marinus TaxID=568069 RepID=A0A1J1J712_9DIPT|nr:CLUMA_CG021019, isoform A [Clunio marinus]